jgi:hypothetical protein
MSEPTRIGDLQIHQDLPHERLEWKIERVGWVLMALVLLTALAGLLGPGPLSRATAGQTGSPLCVHYNRLARHQAPELLRVQIGPGMARDGTVRVWLSREYVQNIKLDNIVPEPESVEAGPERFTYAFNLSEAEQPTTLMFHFEPNAFGRAPAVLGVDGGPEVAFTQFIYP